MQVGNLYLNTDIYHILDELFLEVKLKKSELFSKGYKETGDYLLVQCPYHKFGLERTPSAQFRKSDGLFYCHACKEVHSLDSVINHCLNVNGKQWLLDHFDGSSDNSRQIVFNIAKPKKELPKYVDKSILDKFRYTHPYMFERKLDLETIRKFDVGYDAENDCITFPNKDINGNILFIATRSVKTKFFHYPAGVEKPVYGLYEIYREIKHGKEINEVYVCESMINCLTLWSWGKFAVALNGTGSHNQYEILKKCNIRHFILALDPDNAGKRGTEKLISALSHNKIIDILPVPEGKDVNDLTYEEFCLLEIKKPKGVLL